MKKYFFAVIIFSFTVFVQAQNFSVSQLDSVYNLYLSLREISVSPALQKQIQFEPEIRKCGTGIVEQIKSNLNYFSVEQQTVLAKILQRPTLPNSFLSPGGFFRIHYTNSGTDAVQYDINQLATALDSAYKFEVGYLGYPPPPSDGSAGGDGAYDVYVRNLGNLYGQTSSESKLGLTSWTSYLEIDNDFAGFYTQGINAARVTAAHEFHHAIQMGNYAPQTGGSAIRNSDIFFYEITSTAMEEFVYDSINDYYAYMSSYFRNPAVPLSLNNGYNLAVWNIYLKDVFGFGLLKRQWELMPTVDALTAINNSLVEAGSKFGQVLNDFGIWTHFTNTRSISGQYFEEANNYPLITPTTTVNFNPPQQTYNMNLGPTANYFLKVNLPGGDGTFISLVSNSDIQKAIENPNQVFDFSISIFNDDVSGNQILNDEYSLTFSRQSQPHWNNAGILNNIVVYSDSSGAVSDAADKMFFYPSPFRYSDDQGKGITIVFDAEKLSQNEIDFYVYSTSLSLIYNKKASVLNSYTKNSKNYYEVIWDGKDNNQDKLASGVYLVIIKIDSDIKTGKLVIFND